MQGEKRALLLKTCVRPSRSGLTQCAHRDLAPTMGHAHDARSNGQWLDGNDSISAPATSYIVYSNDQVSTMPISALLLLLTLSFLRLLCGGSHFRTTCSVCGKLYGVQEPAHRSTRRSCPTMSGVKIQMIVPDVIVLWWYFQHCFLGKNTPNGRFSKNEILVLRMYLSTRSNSQKHVRDCPRK